MTFPKIEAFTALALLVSNAVFAQVDVRDADRAMYPDDVQYDPGIPTPATALGHELGHEPVRHHELVNYITSVAELSDRLSVEVIGYTHERRPILFVVATSTANRARLDDIRLEHVALTEPGQNSTIDAEMPVVTWLNYGVHGAESSGMDAALPFIYYLAAARGDEIERLLTDSVILVTAIFNPDGHNQRINWFDAYGGKRRISDPAHIEHDFSWGFARTNHYFFDLNRQWLLLTQPEARAWMRKWHEWRPNLTVDYHEMGSDSTYYFHPGVATRTNPLVPDEAERLMESMVVESERFLDGEGRLYFHGEDFDNYYIGKGSTFPLVNGGVGVLYEAAAALGREIESDNGLRTYRENIRKHFRTSIASITAATNQRTELLRYQQWFYSSALDQAVVASTKAWVVTADGDEARLHLFADLLNYHRITTHRLNQDLRVDGQVFTAEQSLVIPTNQAQHRLIRSVFEPLSEFEDKTFYDVSTWTLPPAFGLRSAALGSREVRGDVVGASHSPEMPAETAPDTTSYGYVFEWDAYYAPRALQRVLEDEMLARVAMEPFSATTTQGVVEFGRGSIVVPFDRQTVPLADISTLMATIANEDGVPVHALTSGRSATGTAGYDLGGPSFKPVKLPSTLLVVGRDISTYDPGEIWHLLDYRMNMPVTLRDRDRLDGIDWTQYTHVVFSGGEYEEYEPDFLDRLRLWVNEGGTLIGLRSAAPWVRANTIDYIDPESEEALAAAEEPVDAEAEEEDDEPLERQPYSDKDDIESVDIIGGAIFSADLDVSHPLGFGYADRQIYLHKNVHEPFEPTENAFAQVIVYDDSPVWSGYVSQENSEALASTPALLAERVGNGSVILFADNPNFRGYWYGTNKLFLNALFFSLAFDPPAEE